MQTILFSLIAYIIFTPVLALAQQNLVNLPIGETASFNDYINAVYLMFISIAALIAVIKIIIAGVKYMFSDIFTQKSDAKRDIQGSLLGLLVVLGAVIVLSIINPDLASFNPNITPVQVVEPPTQPVGTGGGFGSDAANTLMEACDSEVLSCNIDPCDTLDFGDDGSSWLESIQNLVGLDYVMNRTACEVTCDLKGGAIVTEGSASGSCVSPNTDSVAEAEQIIIADIMENSAICDANGCQAQDCAAIRWEFSCSSWCENRGGVAVNLSFMNGASQCIRPVIEGTENDQFSCSSVGRGQFDCNAAALECKSYGKTPEIDPGPDNFVNQQSISCD